MTRITTYVLQRKNYLVGEYSLIGRLSRRDLKNITISFLKLANLKLLPVVTQAAFPRVAFGLVYLAGKKTRIFGDIIQILGYERRESGLKNTVN